MSFNFESDKVPIIDRRLSESRSNDYLHHHASTCTSYLTSASISNPITTTSSSYEKRIHGTSLAYSLAQSTTNSINNLDLEYLNGSNDCIHPPILFVHGLASNKQMLKLLAIEIHKRLGNSVAIFDLRGHGKSKANAHAESPDHMFNMKTMVDDTVEVLKYLKTIRITDEKCRESYVYPWQRPVILIGHSYGGNIVMEVIKREIDLDICAVICIDGGFINLKKMFSSFEKCRLALQPPSFKNVTRAEIEELVRDHWCKGWSQQGMSAMLSSFEYVWDNGVEFVQPCLSYTRHMRLLSDLWQQQDPHIAYCTDTCTASNDCLNVNVLFIAISDGSNIETSTVSSTCTSTRSPFSGNKSEDISDAFHTLISIALHCKRKYTCTVHWINNATTAINDCGEDQCVPTAYCTSTNTSTNTSTAYSTAYSTRTTAMPRFMFDED